MAYRKLGRTNKHRRSMLQNLTKDLINNEKIVTTEARAKEVRKSFDKMVSYGKNGSLVARRNALAFLENDTATVKKIFDDLAKRFENRNGGYTRILKLSERRGDDALKVIICLTEEKQETSKKESKSETKKEAPKKEVKKEEPKKAEKKAPAKKAPAKKATTKKETKEKK